MSELTRRLRILDEGLWHRLDSFHRFAVANRALLAWLVILAVAAFGYDLVSFSLKTDGELHALTPGAKLAWIREGRWAMYFLNVGLMPDSVMPFLPMLIGLLGLACGVLFFILSLSERRGVSDYLATPVVIGCPLLAFGFYFTTLNYGLGVALAVSGAGHYSLTRWRWSSAAVATACFAIAIGIYQTTLLLMPVLFGFYLVARVIAEPGLDASVLLRRLGVFCAVMLVAWALYESVTAATLRAYHVRYAQEYLQSYLNWGADPSYWRTTIRKTLAIAKAYYTGGSEYYLYELAIVAVLFWVTLSLTVVRMLAATQSPVVKVVGLLALAGSLTAPLVMHLANGGYMPPRTVLGVPFVFAGLVFCATVQGNRTVNVVLGMLVLACFFKFAVVNNRYALANELAWKADQDLSLLILQRVHAVWDKLPEGAAPYPVMLVGLLEARESPLYVQRDLIGSSFYHTNGGNAGRVVGLWRSMRDFDFRDASNQEAIVAAGRAIVMPAWPAEGSVDVLDGVVVVKLGDFTAQQIVTLCTSAPTSDFCERDAQRLLTLAGSRAGTAAIYQGRWESSPAGSEDGWGLELAHQGHTVFVSWFTYDSGGRGWWLTMSAQRQKSNVYAGPLIETRGPSFAASAFDPADVVSTMVGDGKLTFSDANNATFDYTLKGIRQSKPVTRTAFETPSPCPPGEVTAVASDPNYGGDWWASPAGSESGWGLSLNQSGDKILGTWFTYDRDGAPLWLSIAAAKTGAGTYAGDLIRKAGARFDAFDGAAVRSTKVGTATFDFSDADNGTFAFTIDGIGAGNVARTKAITRAVANSSGILCRWRSPVDSQAGEVAGSTSTQPSR